MRTIMANKATVEKKWYLIDAADKPLGRVASEVATLLRGKHKPTFTRSEEHTSELQFTKRSPSRMPSSA